MVVCFIEEFKNIRLVWERRIGAAMEKAIVNMSNWELYVYNERYYLSGIADKHPKLGRNTYIAYTSKLEKYSFEEDVLTYETMNTKYKCALKYMNTKPYGNVVPEYKRELIKRDETSDSMLDKIIAASVRLSVGVELDDGFVAHILKIAEAGKAELESMKAADDDRMIEIAKRYDDCIYIEVSNIDAGDKLAYHLGNKCGTIDPSVHSGMFQDSILYMKYRQNEEDTALDFRYFPRGLGDCIETYSWSDNIKQAVIKNICDHSIRFNEQEIAPGETKAFTTKGHKESLISPDCYNGKSALFYALQKDD